MLTRIMGNKEMRGRVYPVKQARVDQGNQSTICFVTVCTKKRKKVLATPESHELLVQSWIVADTWLVGRYMILPDHIHLFCSPTEPESPNVKRWVAYWKFLSSKSWLCSDQKPIWQRDCWDRQLRNGESWGEKWEYVCHNPVRHGLVEEPEAWPYQGEMNYLEWHDA